ncbi:MAG: hypothetical protein JWN44_701 [Myxococcales bacterium]|nr:hypothetical protein [Myxococcales bacterium]
MQRQRSGVALARGLGWFSIGLGVSQLIAPRGLARLIGVPDHTRSRSTMLAVGVRELMAGFGILSRRGQAPGWLWARVGGDMIDLALLVSALRSERSDKRGVFAALGAVAGVTALDTIAAAKLSRSAEGQSALVLSGTQEARYQVTINRPIEEVYRLWRQLSPIESDQELIEELANSRVLSRTKDARVEYLVTFLTAPGGRGTELQIRLRYDLLGGAIGSAAAKLFHRDPAQRVKGDLRRFKQIVETGDVVHSDASIHRGMHAARPSGGRRAPLPQPSTERKELTI